MGYMSKVASKRRKPKSASAISQFHSVLISQFEQSENCRWGGNRGRCLSSLNLRLTSPFKEPSPHTRR
jgi:hypothetical protein